MKKIVFATNNKHKLEEAQQILGNEFKILSLADINCHEELPETSDTLEGNAHQKAEYVWSHYFRDEKIPVFADDTGLEVEALGGEPGVLSARYAAIDGDPLQSHDSEANMKKLLRKLDAEDNRTARFRTVISLVIDASDTTTEIPLYMEKRWEFEGIVNGQIIRERRGTTGFGYDPIFQPDGYEQTFAELGADIKNQISHRARAMQKLAEFLKDKNL